MTNNHEIRIAELERQIESLQTLLNNADARLNKRIAEQEEGMDYYIELHGREHSKMSKMLWAAYCKTHPEVVGTLIECDKILGHPADDGSDPQP